MGQGEAALKDRIDPAIPAKVWRFFERQRTQVWLDPEGENFIRAQSPSPAQGKTRADWQVCVQGWPNLVHELAHVLQSGKLDEDSGFEYQLVPLDLSQARGRGYLWDELGACALSCAWSAGYRSEDWVQDWFCEQVEILPVFFGDEAQPQRFLEKVDRCMREHAEELAFCQARLWAMARQLDCCDDPQAKLPLELRFPGPSTARELVQNLASAGSPAYWCEGMTRVKGPFCVAALWQRYRAQDRSLCRSN